MNDRKDTALGVARARFVEGLARKSAELRGAVALLVAAPGGDRPREEMRRRLHALYASAQVFRIDALAEALKEGIQRLDAARDQKRSLAQEDLDALAGLASKLAALGSGEASARPSRPPPGGSRAAKGTLLGMALPVAPIVPLAPATPATTPGREHKGTLQGAAPPPSESQPALPRAPVTSPGRQQKGTYEGYGTPAAPPQLEVTDDSATIPGTLRATPAGTIEPVLPRPSALPMSTPRTGKPSGSFTAARTPGDSMPPPEGAAPFAGTVVSVLVLDNAEAQAQVRGLLPPERYEVLAASDPEEALRLARTSAPDIVLADRSILARRGLDFVARLREDALTDFVPVVLLVPMSSPMDPVAVRDAGADDALVKPLDGAKLERVIARVTGLGDTGLSTTALGELSVDEIAQRVADEVREGLVKSAADGRDFKVPLGEGSDVLAAAWSAIARLRTVVSARSGGRVRFRDDARRGGPALLALAPEEDALAAESATEVELSGKHVLVVDDDPGIVWFFAGLLREAGAEVSEAADGREALTKLRARRADVVISDILMPVLDGLALCREIARDPALDGIPVILLSWKEDLLTRMRELQAGASGYLRKEAGAPQILGRVREVLRPRARIEAQLRAGGEVRGSVERVGILPLLRTIATERPDARVTVRDALHLFEADVRGGQLVSLTRTSTDGSFGRGKGALAQLIGVTAGRFTVVASEGAVRPMFQGDIDRVLDEGAARLGALVDAVSGTGLVQAASVELDEDALATWSAGALGSAGQIAAHLAKGESPRALVAQGVVAPQVLESVLVDLARRGVLRAVTGPGGEDRVAESFRLRLEQPGRAAGTDLTPSPPPRAPVDELDEPTIDTSVQMESSPGLEWLGVEESTADVVKQTGEMVEEAARRDSARPPSGERDPSATTQELEMDDLERVSSRPPPKSASRVEEEALAASEAAMDAAMEDAPTLLAMPTPKQVVSAPVQPAAARLAPPQPMQDEESGSPLVLVVIVVALFLVGFFAVRAYEDGTMYRIFGVGAQPLMSRPVPTPLPAATRDAGVSHAAATDAGEGAVDAGAQQVAPPVAPVPDDGTADALRFGRVVDGIVDAGVPVAAGQGLLLVQPPAAGSTGEVVITIDGADAGVPPLGMALQPGTHEVAFHHGSEVQYRFVNVHAGKTHITAPP